METPNLEPRAKIKTPRCSIGDVVIVKEYDTLIQRVILNAFYNKCRGEEGWEYGIGMKVKPQYPIINDEDILKNLTTNISYE